MASETGQELRKWLKRHPQPDAILCYKDADDDDPKTLNIGSAKSRWRDAENACDAYPILEAMAGGKLLRRFERDGGVGEESVRKPTTAFDPESARLQHFSTLLAEAHSSIDKAFERQTELLTQVMSRNVQLETARWKELQEWERALAQREREVASAAEVEGSGDISDVLAKGAVAMLPALMGAASAPPPEEPAPNGRKK